MDPVDATWHPTCGSYFVTLHNGTQRQHEGVIKIRAGPKMQLNRILISSRMVSFPRVGSKHMLSPTYPGVKTNQRNGHSATRRIGDREGAIIVHVVLSRTLRPIEFPSPITNIREQSQMYSHGIISQSALFQPLSTPYAQPAAKRIHQPLLPPVAALHHGPILNKNRPRWIDRRSQSKRRTGSVICSSDTVAGVVALWLELPGSHF